MRAPDQTLAAAGGTAGWPAPVVDQLGGSGAGPEPRIQVVHNGPYVVSGDVTIEDHLGRPVEHDDVTALCRCGESDTKPRCDGACIRTGFDDAKSPDRVPDRRDDYVGQQVEIFDNRGICQHSGLCTDRVSSAFHSASEPFVTPSGGRMDELVRAVRDCPSGALSYAADGVEARDQVDHHGTRQPSVLITKDGPYRVSGNVELVAAEAPDDSDGGIARAEGASREHFALCRCGHSQNKPFCSGMHWYVGFHDPVTDQDTTPTIFEWVGGYPALERMTRLFYEKHVPGDELIGPLFATMSADHPQRVAAWLGEVFGGPTRYSSTYGGYHRMLSQHVGKRISEEQRARWVQLLTRAAFEAGLPNDPEFRSVFGSYIEWGSRLAFENSQSDARPPENMPMPHWTWTTAAGPPGSRVSALRPADDADAETDPEPVLPGPDEPVGFDAHIKQLFRRRDRQSMQFAFDLWSYGDVRTHAPAILERLANGSMPCDGAWPADRVEVFRRWTESGLAE